MAKIFFFKSIKQRFFSKNKFFFFLKKIKYYINFKKIYFYLPSLWKFIIIQNFSNKLCLLFLYSSIYFFKIIFNNKFVSFYYCYMTKVLAWTTFKLNSNLLHYQNYMFKLFFTFSKPVFLRLKFKGKGYYIFKNKRNTITPQFGYAHRIYIYSFFIYVKFLRKTSILIFGLNFFDILFISYKCLSKRYINIFTGRGIRFSRQYIYRKKGKISTYR